MLVMSTQKAVVICFSWSKKYNSFYIINVINLEDNFFAAARQEFEYMTKTAYLEIVYSTLH